MTKSPLSVSVKPPTSLPVFGLNATTCAPSTPRPALVTRPLMLPNCAREGGRPVDVRDAGDVVGLERTVGDAAAGERDRKHHGLGGHDAAAAADELGLAERRMRQAEQVPDLVERDRLDVIAIGAAGLGGRPGKDGVEVDVRLEDPAVGLVDGERRGGERAILSWLTEVADHVRAIVDKRPRLHEPDERR